MSEPVIFEREGAVCTITLNRPEKRNPISDPAMIAGLEEAARRIDADPGQALRMAKRLLHEARHASLETVLELSAALQAIAHATPEHREALGAFAPKRPRRS